MYEIYVSGRGGIYGYTADESPAKGDIVLLDTSELRVRIDEVVIGEDGKPNFTASPE